MEAGEEVSTGKSSTRWSTEFLLDLVWFCLRQQLSCPLLSYGTSNTSIEERRLWCWKKERSMFGRKGERQDSGKQRKKEERRRE